MQLMRVGGSRGCRCLPILSADWSPGAGLMTNSKRDGRDATASAAAATDIVMLFI